jgi:hypothetical protein
MIAQARTDPKLRRQSKGLRADQSLVDCLGQEEVDRMLDQRVWGCGDRANRLCLLLASNELSDTATSATDIEDDAAMKALYLAIAKSKDPALVIL